MLSTYVHMSCARFYMFFHPLVGTLLINKTCIMVPNKCKFFHAGQFTVWFSNTSFLTSLPYIIYPTITNKEYVLYTCLYYINIMFILTFFFWHRWCHRMRQLAVGLLASDTCMVQKNMRLILTFISTGFSSIFTNAIDCDLTWPWQ